MVLCAAVRKGGSTPNRACWRRVWWHLVDATVKCGMPVACALKPVETGQSSWMPTYGPGIGEALPIQIISRRSVDYRTWLWVWGCKKIKVPPCFGPGPSHALQWPYFIHLWVGPDGHPIKPHIEYLLLKWWVSLHRFQMQL
jgi:hypothetical protein